MRCTRPLRWLAPVLLLAAPIGAAAQPAPAAAPSLAALAPGQLHAGIAALPDPTQTYDLYLPSSFRTDRSWPLLLVFDPRARGGVAAEIFRPAAEKWGWIVASSNDTMSDTPTIDQNIRAVNAMWPDLMTRLPIDPDRVYATGFSGGAMLAWIVGQQSGKLAGVISVGGRPIEGFETQPPRFDVWLAAGRTDFNHTPSWELEELAAKGDRLHRLEYFEGPHSWFPAEEAERAMAWLEALAMREKRRPTDPELVARLFAADLESASAALAGGDALTALRRFEAIAATYESLVDVSAVEAKVRELERDSRVKQAHKDERWGRSYEAATRRHLGEALALVNDREEVPPTAARIRAMLNVPGMLADAAAEGLRGDAARRAIAIVHVQLGFYQMRDLFAAKEYARAAPLLEIAVELQPEDVRSWYNLACAQARAGRPDEALAALERAIAIGLPPRMASPAEDPDLESLRDRPEFTRLVAKARG